MRDRLRTDKGVECYERLKSKAPGVDLLSLFHRHHLRADPQGAGRQDPALPWATGGRRAVGSVFHLDLQSPGSYWTAADIAIQYIAKEGGLDKLKGKKIAYIYHDSPYGKEPIPALEARAKKYGFELKAIAGHHPGVEQKSQWLKSARTIPTTCCCGAGA